MFYSMCENDMVKEIGIAKKANVKAWVKELHEYFMNSSSTGTMELINSSKYYKENNKMLNMACEFYKIIR